MLDTLFGRVAAALARHAVTAIAAALVARGLADPQLADAATGPTIEVVAGGITMALSAGWSAIAARLAHAAEQGAQN